MNRVTLYSLLYLAGVLISSVAQILLKKSAGKTYTSVIKQYLNLPVLIAYFIFFGATLFSVFAYKYVPLSMGPILEATQYIFIAILSVIFIKEKINKKKLIGLATIILGVIIYSLPF